MRAWIRVLLIALLTMTSAIDARAQSVEKPKIPLSKEFREAFAPIESGLAEKIVRRKLRLDSLLQQYSRTAKGAFSNDDAGSLATSTRDMYYGLVWLQYQINQLASVIAKEDESRPAAQIAELVETDRTRERQILGTLVLSFFESVHDLWAVFRAFYDDSSKQGMGLTSYELDQLSLTLSARLAVGMADIFIENANGAVGQSYNLPFIAGPIPNSNLKRLALSPSQVHVESLSSGLQVKPEGALANDVLRMTALRSIFLREEAQNGLLYTSEKVDTKVADSAPDYIRSLQLQAWRLTNETAYRAYVQSQLSEKIVSIFFQKRGDVAPIAKKRIVDLIKFAPDRLQLDFLLKGLLGVEKLNEAAIDVGMKMLAQMTNDEFLKVAEDSVGTFFDKVFKGKEEKAFRAVFDEVLKKNPSYLSEASDSELLEFVLDLFRGIESKLWQTNLAKIFALESEKDPIVSMVLAAQPELFARDFVSADAITGEMIKAFRVGMRDKDYLASVQRYGLASRLIEAAEMINTGKKVIARIEAQGLNRPVTDMGLIPEAPVPSLVFAALTDPKISSPLFSELVQTLSGMAQDNNADLYRLAVALPERLAKTLDAINSNATDGAIGNIILLHRRLSERQNYRWSSNEAKLATLIGGIDGEDSKKLLEGYQKLVSIAAELHLSTLKALALASLNELLVLELTDNPETQKEAGQKSWFVNWAQLKKSIGVGVRLIRGKRAAFEALGKAIADAIQVTKQQKPLLQEVFFDAETQKEALRKKLLNAETLKKYYELKIGQIELSLPLLNSMIPMPEAIAKVSANPHPIRLSDLIVLLRPTILATAADQGLLVSSMRALKGKSPRKDGLFDAPAETGFKPTELVASALAKTRKDLGIMESVATGIADIFSSADGKHVAPVQDDDWNTKFYVRDILPAFFDTSDNVTRTHRVIVSNILSPYLRSSMHALKHEQGILLDPTKDSKIALANSENYREVVRASSDSAGQGLSEVLRASNPWGETWSDVKKVTIESQTLAGYAFYLSQIVPMGPGLHSALTMFMFVSALFDFTADAGTYLVYFDQFNHLKPFAHSIGLGSATVSHETLDASGKAMSQMLEVLADRSAMDMTFFSGMLQGLPQMFVWKSLRKARQHVDYVAMMNKVDMKNYDYDLMVYQQTAGLVGLPPVLPEDFISYSLAESARIRREYLSSKKARKESGLERDNHEIMVAKRRLSQLDKARKLAIELEAKYGAVLPVAFRYLGIGAADQPQRGAPETRDGVLSETEVQDYYQILGVPRSATQEQIKQRFRQLAKKMHPDRNPSPELAAEFPRISEAYTTLSDVERRFAYDTRMRFRRR